MTCFRKSCVHFITRRRNMGKDIVVLGAGVVGLSTAVNIQSHIPGARVKVIAEHFYNETTSYGSGGIFIPTAQSHAGTNFEKLRQWCADSWQQYSSLATGPDAGISGAIISTGYSLCNDNLDHHQNPMYKDFVYEHERLSDQLMDKLGFRKRYEYGFKVTTIILDQRKYLLWLQQRFRDNNGQFEQRRVTSLNEFVGQCDVLVNCCGLGSRTLLGDRRMYPARGQLVRVNAPWIKHWVLTDDFTYMIPGENFVTLGGMKQIGNETLEVDDNETDDILRRCRDLIPSLKVAKTDHAWAGLRPCRDVIRLEKETVEFINGELEVIHNYGHGSDGVALSWGTALEAADLVGKSLIRRKEAVSKL